MKKILLLCSFCCLITLNAEAQTVPNAGFDSVYIGGIDRLYAWGNSEGCSFEPYALLYNVSVTYTENYLAARLRTSVENGQAKPSFLFSTSFNDMNNPGCNEDFIQTGQPFPYSPDQFTGEYMFWNDSLLTADYGTVSVILKAFNPITQVADTVAYGTQNLHPTPPDSTFESFVVDLQYYRQIPPDSIVIIFYSSGTNLKGGVLTVDNINSIFTNTQNTSNSTLENVQIFPNPTSDEVNIFIKKQLNSHQVAVQVLDIYGRMLEQRQLDTTATTLDMSRYSAGIYFFYLKMDNHVRVVKVVKR